uniref:hypothetical protein n=1 Tax=Leptospira alstonii TaxID=28452 RepID=UPI000A8B8A6B
KLEMVRCRLKRRARPGVKRRGTPLKSNPYSLTPKMDAYFTNQGKTVLTTEEKDRFKLLSSGVTDAWGLWQYDPAHLLCER